MIGANFGHEVRRRSSQRSPSHPVEFPITERGNRPASGR